MLIYEYVSLNYDPESTYERHCYLIFVLKMMNGKNTHKYRYGTENGNVCYSFFNENLEKVNECMMLSSLLIPNLFIVHGIF
jgi:hypothetical protein